MNKRTFLKSMGLVTAGISFAGMKSGLHAAGMLKRSNRWNGVFLQPPLPYAFDALEPYIDAQTMELHYSKHHASYTEKFNAAVEEEGLTGKTALEILSEASKYSDAIRNNGGGFFNHRLFWNMLSPPGGSAPQGTLLAALNRDFGSLDAFKEEFSRTAGSVFGSGWAWLIASDGKLKITATSNQDSPVMDISADRGNPLLCIDVWEHAYYLHYQNRRADYINAFWNVVNWEFVAQRHNLSLSM